MAEGQITPPPPPPTPSPPPPATTKTRLCEVHPKENIVTYCKPCDLLLCPECITDVRHQGHGFVTLPEILKTKKNEITEINTKLKTIYSKYEEAKDKVKYTEEGIQNVLEDVEEWSQSCEGLLENIDLSAVDFAKNLNQKLQNWNPNDPSCPLNDPCIMTDENKELVEDLKALYCDVGTNIDEIQKASDVEHPKTKISVQLHASHDGLKYREFLYLLKYKKNIIAPIDDTRAWICERGHNQVILQSVNNFIEHTCVLKHRVHDLAVTASDELLISLETLPGKIKKRNSKGILKTIYKAPLGYTTQCISVTDTQCIVVTINNSGCHEYKLLQLSPDGHLMNIIQYDADGQTSLFKDPGKVACNRNGDFIVIDRAKKAVILKRNGHKREKFKGIKDLKSHFTDVTSDLEGNILLSDYNNLKVHILNKHGGYLQYIDTNGKPVGIAFDKTGKLWVLGEDDAHNINTLFVLNYSFENKNGQEKNNPDPPEPVITSLHED